MKYAVNVNSIQLINGALLLTYNFTDFLHVDMLCIDRVVLNSPTITVDFYFSLFFYQLLPTYFDDLLLNSYTLRISVSSSCMDPFVIMCLFTSSNFPCYEVCFI